MKIFLLFIFQFIKTNEVNISHLSLLINEKIDSNNMYLLCFMNNKEVTIECIVKLNECILNAFEQTFKLKFDAIKDKVEEKISEIDFVKSFEKMKKEIVVQNFTKLIYKEICLFIQNKESLQITSEEEMQNISDQLKEIKEFKHKDVAEEVMKFCFILFTIIPITIFYLIHDQFKKIYKS